MKMENLMLHTVTKNIFIEHEKEGVYLTLPFSMPADIEWLTLTYEYAAFNEKETALGNGSFATRQQANIIDLGLIAPDGSQVGASGSNKKEIYVSEVYATPGYHTCVLVPGEWRVIVGAYKIAAEGVEVNFEITFSKKHRRLYKGDLHMHTLASDGIFTVGELMERARKLGLDFIAITDHNQMVSSDSFPQARDISVIPGMEYTHYLGHSNFLGVDKPYDDPFIANSFEEVRARFNSARERGALVGINHPFQEGCEFKFDLKEIPFDYLEVWNGPMRESNLKAIGLWQRLLTEGKKIPICGGSDFHRDDIPFIFMGGPTTCVYAKSSSSRDILAAIRAGHAYISYAPNGPVLEMTVGKAILGDSVEWAKEQEMHIVADNLLKGDVLRVITETESKVLLEAPSDGKCNLSYTKTSPGFARIEILRVLLPGIPMLPVLISNPIYFQNS
jgi:hypothetical protein